MTLAPTPVRNGNFSSPLSRYCNEYLPGDFHVLDGDAILFARETGRLLICEFKFPGEELRRSQLETLPVLADCMATGVAAGVVPSGSGVYLVRGEPPFENGAHVTPVFGNEIRFDQPRHYSREEFNRFARCR